VNVYGPTETTSFSTFHIVEDAVAPVPIGLPVPGTAVLLVDANAQIVGPGMLGEIWIAGAGVAAGYVGRDDETAARFVAHPALPGQTFYRTGDLARANDDGSLVFVGRNDDQLKIRGLRIEPAEIAARLAMHARVRACHVLARRRSAGEDLAVTAYVEWNEGEAAPPTRAALRDHLDRRLPAYMIPTYFVVVDHWPLTPNGKVDARALPAPTPADAGGDELADEEMDEMEHALSSVWAEVLGRERVGRDENFFEIGGHSLLAARLFARLDESLGQAQPLSLLFTAPTVRLMAAHYRNASALAASCGPRALVALRTHGHRPALYLLPGVYGNVVGYADLVQSLSPDQPAYGLQALGLDGRTPPFNSIEAMAEHYIAEIRERQPHGPYALVGTCFGATVAYEMARQWLAAGEPVAYLGLIAPASHEGGAAPARRRAPSLERVLSRMHFTWGRLAHYRAEMRDMHSLERLHFVARKLGTLARCALVPRGLADARREMRQQEVYRAHVKALGSYVWRPLSGPMGMFEILDSPRARHGEPDSCDWARRWSGPIGRHEVPGKDSGDMLSAPNAQVLAAILTQRLRLAFTRD